MNNMEQWVVVLDDTVESKAQFDACKALRPNLRGAIQCDLLENENASVCREAAAFPAFCHTPTNSCLYGSRLTLSEMEALVKSVPPPRTTPPDPHPTPTAES